MTNKSKSRHGVRGARQFKLNPTTLAIRSVFALGMGLALATPAFAGTCIENAPNDIECDGVFNGSIVYNVDDLTLVVGGNAATSIIGDVGVAGIDLFSGDGYIDLSNAATIESYGADAILAIAYGDVSIDNSGELSAIYGSGIYAVSVFSDASVDNSGTISSEHGSGITAASLFGDVSVNNSGDITAVYDNGVVGLSTYGNVSVDNNGTISATYGNGIEAGSVFGDVTVTNSGSVFAYDGSGVYAFSYYGDVSIANSGQVSASDYSGIGSASAMGAISVAGYFSDLTNSGSIAASASVVDGTAVAIGAYAIGSMVTHLVNEEGGDISAEATADYGAAIAYGTYVFGGWAGIALTSNYGDISATASVGDGGYAHAIGAFTAGDTSTLINDGSISASADAYAGEAVATGARTYALWGAIYSYGDISASAEADYGSATAIGADAYGYFGSSVYNAGSIAATASAYAGEATAIGAQSLAATYWASYITNEGDIAATASADYGSALAVGTANFGFISYYGDTTTLNNGDISASASAYGGTATAFGAYNYAYLYGSSIENSGSIAAAATADYGQAYAIGAMAYGYAYGDVSVVNAGDISADANAYGGDAVAMGVSASTFYGGTALIDNSGSISASASADYGVAAATGAQSLGVLYSSASLVNSGDIDAFASAYGGEATAYGATVSSKYDGLTSNSGGITATAEADYGQALAVGSVTAGKYASALYNEGDISASASAYAGEAIAYGAIVTAGYYDALTYNAGDISADATADYGLAVAYGSITTSDYGNAILENSGDITASAQGDYAYAYGALVAGYYDAVVVNDGSIVATAAGYYNGVAIGVFADAVLGDVLVENTGSITATGDGEYTGAIAVLMRSDGTNTLVNEGTITAAGDYYSVAVLSTSLASAQIYNYGTITGSIHTGILADYVYNDGIWNLRGTSTFAAGDDAIYNTGAIVFNNSAIDLGDYATDGNAFDNEGTIRVRGANNWIDMGLGNPLAFYNGGVIDFLDGAANDILTIYGDFTGSGSISVDLNGLTGASDVLYIDGDIVGSSVTTINGTLLSPITDVSTEIAVIGVSGTSLASNFAVGTITTAADSLLSFDFSLVGDIDASNASADVLSIGVEVSGLSPGGVLASSVAPGVQNLWHTAVGTAVQREGAARAIKDKTFSLWLRGFSSDGDITPDGGNRSFGASGSQRFDQQNSGIEAGVAYSFNEQLSAGLLFGRADADIDPATGGGSRLDGDTFGVYGSWIPGSFHLDASYHRMNYDVEAAVGAVAFTDQGVARGYSIEMGYGFSTGGGLQFEPQFQYSHMSTDSLTVVSSVDDFVSGTADSSRARLGGSLSKTFETGNGNSWTPYLTASAVRESEGENRYTINGAFTGDNSMRGNSTLIEAGATGRLGAWTVFGGLTWQDGDALNSVLGGQLGVRYTFARAGK